MKLPMALLGSLALACAAQEFPWHFPAASRRQCLEISSSVHRVAPPVTVKLADAARCRLVLPEKTDSPLACHVHGDAVSFVFPGEVGPGKSPRVLVYWSEATDWQPSPRLAAVPEPQDDFARIVLGREWDFAEDQCGIRAWGDRPDHIGRVTIEDGWMKVPVTGNDPYFIWGCMFGAAPADDPFKLDSSLFSVLELRVRQDQPDQQWCYFVTDMTGTYRKGTFRVPGTAPHTVRIDLSRSLPDFWDGRMFRALRIDLPKQPGITAWVDYVRVLPRPPQVVLLPVLRRDELATTAAAAGCEFTALPKTFTAGAEYAQRVVVRAAAGGVLAEHPLCWVAQIQAAAGDSKTQHGNARTDADGAFVLPLTAPKRAGAIALSVGLADAIGRQSKAAKAEVLVAPAALSAYDLRLERSFVLSTATAQTLTVWGLDEFGNRQPVDIAAPRWQGAEIPAGPLRGNPATIAVSVPATPQCAHVISLVDAEGRRGQTWCSVIAPMPKQRKDNISIGPHGYLQHPDGTLFTPFGGLYANWPHGKPQENGRLQRSLDLFPCSANNYQYGYPWPPEVEQKVKDYLEHCASRGLTALRLMLRNMDLVGKVDRTQLQAVLHMFDLARPLGIKFNVALCEDYVKPPYGNSLVLERVVMQHYSEEELATLPPHRRRFLVEKRLLRNPYDRYLDEDVIACQKDYLRELIPILADREEIFCYEFENEMIRPPLSWCNDISDFIRSIDPHTLILANPHPILWPAPLQWRESNIDLFCDHPYNNGQPDADRGALMFTRAKWCLASGKPSLTGEGGVFPASYWSRLGVDYDSVIVPNGTRFARDQVWLSLTAGYVGVMYWTVDLDSKAVELGKPTRVFAALGVDLRSFQRRRPPLAVVMPADDSKNMACFALVWKLMALGADFDTVPANEAAGYSATLDLATLALDQLPALPVFARPAAGYQATALVSKDGQALVYLRNAAAVVNPDPKLPTVYVREVREAQPALTFDAFPYTSWRAYDLDEDKLVTMTRTADGLALPPSTHDFVLYLK
ncbi:MAG: hypothetical protein ACOX9E_06435 [Lentisphaeria bacterium]|jgi:hypothetical protein